MKSAKEQAFWVTFGLAMVLLLGGSGFYLVQSAGGYSSSTAAFNQQGAQKKKLESAAIYPSQENLDALKKTVDEFEGTVNGLHDQLKAFQKPLEQVSDQQFPQILKAMIEKFREHAFQQRVVIPEGFYFGMDEYATTLPRPEATGILKYQLDSVDHLLRSIIANGADEIISLQRERTAVEAGQENPELRNRVVKYPVKVSFVTGHDGFRDFLNTVSNDKSFFYIVRVLRVDNETKEGPSKSVEQRRLAKDPTTGEVIEITEGQDVAAAGLQEYDARIVFGGEKLRVTAVVDLCRFPEIADLPPEPAAPTGPPGRTSRPAANRPIPGGN
jgi:hypothetical protein